MPSLPFTQLIALSTTPPSASKTAPPAFRIPLAIPRTMSPPMLITLLTAERNTLKAACITDSTPLRIKPIAFLIPFATFEINKCPVLTPSPKNDFIALIMP